MEKFDYVMMKTAEIWADMSYCQRLKVGAVLAKDGRILSTGYNGTVSGTSNFCECYEKYNNEKEIDKMAFICPECGGRGKIFQQYGPYGDLENCQNCNGLGKLKFINKTNEFTVHAEQNIISFCAKNGIPTEGTTLYVTHNPCKTCAKLIVQSGIKRVVYKEEYRDDGGIAFLKKVGVKIDKM